MSHIVTITTDVRDPARSRPPAGDWGWPSRSQARRRCSKGKSPGYSSGCRAGSIRWSSIPGPAQVRFDNFAGSWGNPTQLDRFLQAYALEKAKIEARRKGFATTEQALADGSIKLTIEVGGTA